MAQTKPRRHPNETGRVEAQQRQAIRLQEEQTGRSTVGRFSNTQPPQNDKDPNWPLQSFDHVDWASAFMERVNAGITVDEAFMRVWFANALMRGYDEHAQRKPVTTDLMRKAGAEVLQAHDPDFELPEDAAQAIYEAMAAAR